LEVAKLLARDCAACLRRFMPQSSDPKGFQPSTVLKRKFRLDRNRDRRGRWRYDLQV